MKKLIALVSVLFCALCLCSTFAAEPSVTRNIRNKVRIVDADADLNVRIVNADAKIHVYPLQGGAKLNALMVKAGVRRKLNNDDINLSGGYGEWEFVEQGEDFTVRFVDKKEDFTIKFVFDVGALTRIQQMAVAAKHVDDSLIVVQNAAYAARRAEEQAVRDAKDAARKAEAAARAAAQKPKENCHCKGIPLHGRVRVVNGGADFRVEVVDAAADLHVKVLERSPSNCGEWYFVEGGADFTVEFVKGGADFKIKYVETSPGVR